MVLPLGLLAFSTAPDALDAKVEPALNKLPLERKIELIGGCQGFNIMPIPELGIPKILMNDGPLGVRGDNVSRPATAYPAAVSLASTWNSSLAKEFGVSLGRDALGRTSAFVYEELAECQYVLGLAEESKVNFALAYEGLAKDPWVAEDEPDRVIRLGVLAGIVQPRND